MSTALKTPGVYVEEVTTLPASVAQVETAIPAFIGFTATAPETFKAIPVTSIREYEALFGSPQHEAYTIAVNDTTNEGQTNRAIAVNPATNGSQHSQYLLYYSLQGFFQNGGGKCYIISVGNYSAALSAQAFTDGLEALKKEDEPTLIVFPDAVGLTGDAAASSYYGIAQQALAQAAQLGDRFVVVDVFGGDVTALRNNIGINNLKYGAAYYPFLNTTTSYAYDEAQVAIAHTIDGQDGTLPGTLPALQAVDSALYNNIKQQLDGFKVVLPPSALVVGAYAKTDRDRGVWKAPANISINGIINPTVRITNQEQDGLNIDTEGGKSINAIRTFAGKGTLIWGARTLAGNDNEWRYVSVRRFFNMVEESLKKSTSWAVFESNNAHTWIRVKSMVQNYLLSLWKQGALAGGTPDQAFFVKIGLGETMTSLDVLEGRMNVEIGLATVRPAEFIVLKFSHKLQE